MSKKVKLCLGAAGGFAIAVCVFTAAILVYLQPDGAENASSVQEYAFSETGFSSVRSLSSGDFGTIAVVLLIGALFIYYIVKS